MSKRTGLKNLRYRNLKVAMVNSPFEVKSEFVKNPDYLNNREAVNGWWKLTCNNYIVLG